MGPEAIQNHGFVLGPCWICSSGPHIPEFIEAYRLRSSAVASASALLCKGTWGSTWGDVGRLRTYSIQYRLLALQICFL